MKNQRIIKISILGLITLLSFTFCAREIESCKKCMSVEPHEKTLIHLYDENMEFDIWHGESSLMLDPNYSLRIATSDVSNSKLETLAKELKINELIKKDVETDYLYLGIVIFSNNIENTIISSTSLDPLMVYVQTENNIKIRILKPTFSGYSIVPEFNTNVKAITTNDIYVAANIFRLNYSDEVIATSILNAKYTPAKNGQNFYHIVYNHSLELGAGKISNTPFPVIDIAPVSTLVGMMAGGGTCGYPCSSSDGACTHKEKPSGPGNDYCNTMCAESRVEFELTASNNESITAKDKLTLYAFRDDFLKNSVKGRLYIHYYYTLSQYIMSDIDLSISVKTLDVIVSEIIPAIHKVLSKPNDDLTILISPTSSIKIQNFINEQIKPLNDDVYFQQIVEVVVADIKNYEGKTIYEVTSDFNK
jgi:hypothetical protein